ncbi:MAG: hypothetical protein J0M12_05800 [Deltaproteobacteria bacterium]|nr:hypothetical protein [Deltaproteobacteria bacterium]
MLRGFIQRFSLLLACLCLAAQVDAQVSITTPTVSDTKLASAPDYASEVLSDAWDMDKSSDFANFIDIADLGSGITNLSFSGGLANFTIPSAEGAFFHLLSPGQCSTNALGKNGQAFPIDTTKYRYLSIRMNTTVGSEMRVLWYRGCNYATNWVRSLPISTSPGWHTYTIDLATIGHQSSSGGDVAWNAAPATGLRIDPGYSGTLSIDWVRLTGTPPAEGSSSASYSFTSSGANSRHSMFLDDDDNPFNGYTTAPILDSGSTGTLNVSTEYLAPGSYRVSGVTSDDFATLRADPWDMQSSVDVQQMVGVSNPSFSSGAFTGTASGDAYFLLNLFGASINSSVYRYLCFQMTSASSGPTFLVWQNSSGTTLGYFSMAAGANVYSIDLQGQTLSSPSSQTLSVVGAGWSSGNWTKLRIPLRNGAFSVGWVALRQNGCSSSDSPPSPVLSPGHFIVNSPPTLKILQPDNRGGADFASTVLGNPWNFDNTDDVVSYAGLSTAEIYPNNYVDGLQGDFFHGTSSEGSGDPYNPVLQQSPTSSQRVDTSRFKNLIYKLNVARTQDVANGSVVRVIWQAAADGDALPFNGDDTMTQDGWNEYVQDMTKINLEPIMHAPGSYINPPWHGNVNYLRIDAHEFTPATEFYFDYVRLTADDETNSQFAITYELSDSDDDPSDVLVSFYYSASASLTNPQTIVQNLAMNRDSNVYLWDTSSLPAGTYYVFGIADDGYNTMKRTASGRLVKSSLPQDSTAPALVLDEPTAGRTIYSSMVVSGYGIDNIQTANIEVLADGELLGSFRPGRYSKAAHLAYATYAEAGNAGFFERIDTSGLSDGNHLIVVKIYDTAGNITSSGSISVDKAAGTDPSPIPEPTPENESPLTVPGTVATLTLTAKLDAKKNTASFKITGGLTCSQVDLIVSEKKSDLVKTVPVGTVLYSGGGSQSISLSASKLKGLVKKTKDIPVYVAALCNGQRTTPVKKISPVNLQNKKKLKTAAKWIAYLDTKLR